MKPEKARQKLQAWRKDREKDSIREMNSDEIRLTDKEVRNELLHNLKEGTRLSI